MSSRDRISVGAVRRATAGDSEAIAARFPGLPHHAAADNRAAFVIDGDGGPVGVLCVAQAPDHLLVECVAVAAGSETDGIERTLVTFAEMMTRAIGLREVRLADGSLAPDVARSFGYRNGAKRLMSGRLARMFDHLEAVGVPPWRAGTAPLDLVLYYRGIWSALALLFGFGCVTLAVTGPGEITFLRVVVPAVLCLVSTVFAAWQIGLIAVAARRDARRILGLGILAASAVALAGIGVLVHQRAIPALTELWAIYTGDEDLAALSVTVSPDGTTLRVEGSYGVRSAEIVRRALDDHPSLRRVILAGPGGRVGTAFDIYRMIRNRRLATRVEAACASACTIAFLGGVDRSISPSGRLGFHQGSFPGLGDNDTYESNRDMRRFMVANGITPAFAQRAIDTPHDDIWVPTPDELLAGRVIQRVEP